MLTDSRKELLCKAAALLGREQLAIGLNVPPALLDAWMSGHASMPDRKLRVLGDLLEEISNPPKQ